MEYRRCNQWAEEEQHGDRINFFCALEKGRKSPNHSKYPGAKTQGVQFGQVVTRLDKDIQRLKEELDEKKKLREIRGADIRVRCLGWTIGGKGCGASFKVSSLTYIQTHWYTPPYSCTGGDYWNMGEGQFKCPTCGALNRLYERPEVEKLKHLFKSTENTY